jgi:hypothetical protein
MKKHSRLIVGLALALVLLLSACGNTITPAANSLPSAASVATITDAPGLASASGITNTPDPCGPENIEEEVLKVHKYMREFDDASNLASLPELQPQQRTDAIAELQRIRREAEDQVIPPCVGDLKTYQISHMNAVINTLIAMLSGSDQQQIDQGIASARNQHDRYLIELARVLGLTIEPANAAPLPTETPSP